MIEIPDVQPITMPVHPPIMWGVHCAECADDRVLEMEHYCRDEADHMTVMPPETRTYHLTLSFDCDHDGHARMIAEYIINEMRKKIPQEIDATFEVR